MSKTTNRFSPDVRQRAVRMVMGHEHEHASRWTAMGSIAAKIGCTGQPLNDWAQKAEVIHLCGPWRSFEAVELATLARVNWFNNPPAP